MDHLDETPKARTWIRYSGPVGDWRLEELTRRADLLRINSAVIGTVIFAAAVLVGYDQRDMLPRNLLLVALLAISCLFGLVVVLYGWRRAGATRELVHILRLSQFRRRRSEARAYARGTSRPVRERFIGRARHGDTHERDHIE